MFVCGGFVTGLSVIFDFVVCSGAPVVFGLGAVLVFTAGNVTGSWVGRGFLVTGVPPQDLPSFWMNIPRLHLHENFFPRAIRHNWLQPPLFVPQGLTPGDEKVQSIQDRV